MGKVQQKAKVQSSFFFLECSRVSKLRFNFFLHKRQLHVDAGADYDSDPTTDKDFIKKVFVFLDVVVVVEKASTTFLVSSFTNYISTPV